MESSDAGCPVVATLEFASLLDDVFAERVKENHYWQQTMDGLIVYLLCEFEQSADSVPDTFSASKPIVVPVFCATSTNSKNIRNRMVKKKIINTVLYIYDVSDDNWALFDLRMVR